MIEHRIRTALAYCTTLACATLSQFTLAAEFAPGDKHVALGSSFAAGPGVDLQLGNCGRSTNNYANLTARALGLHVNTVYQRLERVDQVLGDRAWRGPQGVLELQMALQFHRLLGPSAG